VRYRRGSETLVIWRPCKETALEVACSLISQGFDVSGVGTGPLTHTIDKDEIARIYTLWERERPW
jgi:hypothetical protein